VLRGLHNLYGPTEAAVSVTHWTTNGADTTHSPDRVCRSGMSLATCWTPGCDLPRSGAPGRVVLGWGGNWRAGYLGRPDLTSDRFVADPFGDSGCTDVTAPADLVQPAPRTAYWITSDAPTSR